MHRLYGHGKALRTGFKLTTVASVPGTRQPAQSINLLFALDITFDLFCCT